MSGRGGVPRERIVALAKALHARCLLVGVQGCGLFAGATTLDGNAAIVLPDADGGVPVPDDVRPRIDRGRVEAGFWQLPSLGSVSDIVVALAGDGPTRFVGFDPRRVTPREIAARLLRDGIRGVVPASPDIAPALSAVAALCDVRFDDGPLPRASVVAAMDRLAADATCAGAAAAYVPSRGTSVVPLSAVDVERLLGALDRGAVPLVPWRGWSHPAAGVFGFLLGHGAPSPDGDAVLRARREVLRFLVRNAPGPVRGTGVPRPGGGREHWAWCTIDAGFLAWRRCSAEAVGDVPPVDEMGWEIAETLERGSTGTRRCDPVAGTYLRLVECSRRRALLHVDAAMLPLFAADLPLLAGKAPGREIRWLAAYVAAVRPKRTGRILSWRVRRTFGAGLQAAPGIHAAEGWGRIAGDVEDRCRTHLLWLPPMPDVDGPGR